ncbi:cyclase family protein [Nocardia sp. NPDC049220]|uniref:cyclase family protein n=1 Tax=Nocardia sp. NPDC049220 TaxID=3155273 RepID=UPI0033F9164A
MTEHQQMAPGDVHAHAVSLGVRPNWGRWGAEDERGTLNLVTADNVLRATAAVRTGTVVSLGRPLDPTDPPYYPQGLDSAVRHEMVTAWGSNAGGDVQAASDQVHIQCHGLDNTHMDALCHIGYGGVGYNGRPFASMVDMTGASVSDMLVGGPVVTRAVLVDVPRLRGVDHLDGGDPVTEDDLRMAAPDLRPGDALIVRTGRARAVAGSVSAAEAEGRTAERKYGPIAGLHHGAMRVVSELDCGLLGTDGSADNFPAVDDHRLPIHVLCLVHLGVHLLHNLALEELADALAARGGSDFLIVAAPLRLPGGTGSPIAPVAVL